MEAKHLQNFLNNPGISKLGVTDASHYDTMMLCSIHQTSI